MEALVLLLAFGVVMLVGRAMLARGPRERDGSSGAVNGSDAAYSGLAGDGGGHLADDRDHGSHDLAGDSGFDGGGDGGGGDGGGD